MFGITVLKDERLVVVVEQKPDCSEDQCFKWMSNVIQVSCENQCTGIGVMCPNDY